MSGHLTPRHNPYLNHQRTNTVRLNESVNLQLRVNTNPKILSIACPTCGAKPDGACLVKAGFKETFTLTEVHQGRIDAYRKASHKGEGTHHGS